MKNKLKKWNWAGFTVILILCCVGAAGNKSIHSIRDFVILVSLIGLPFALFVAWMSRDE
jgi:hypothetical protein